MTPCSQESFPAGNISLIKPIGQRTLRAHSERVSLRFLIVPRILGTGFDIVLLRTHWVPTASSRSVHAGTLSWMMDGVLHLSP
jgi:hypothetical protein